MTITAANDISDLYNISSDAVKNTLYGSTQETEENQNMFGTLLNAAMNNINETNGYLSDQENEELKIAMGISENTHDLSIAIQKAETALQYTLAVRDKLLTAYNEIMQIQI
ncbi:MAG: flagellar hook-basal body complex protein FliE [Lachnospiraceae bacterium]|nr:flagellar hook-basal body complex protein FliE [Lachnospiraceae bacterium]